jgi:hypothetical protein
VPLFWLGPAAGVDAWDGWWRCTLGVFSKVGCSGSSAVVGRIWVDVWWRGGLSVDSCGGPSPGYKRWLSLLSGIVRVVFELRPR